MKRFIAELVGTFFLAFAVLMIGDPLAVGMMFMAMIYLSGPISGAHLNPAVSLAMFLRNRISLVHLLMYVVAQVIGASLVQVLAYAGLGNVIPAKMIPAKVALFAGVIEFLLSYVLISVILMVTTSTRFKDALVSGLIMGFTLTAVVATIGTYNPAIAAGSLIANAFGGTAMPGIKEALVYLVVPLVAGVAAAWKFRLFYQESL